MPSSFTPPFLDLGALPRDTAFSWDGFDIAQAEASNVTSWLDRVAAYPLTTSSLYPKFYSGGLNGNPWVLFSSATPSKSLVCASSIFSGSYSGFWTVVVLRVPAYAPAYGDPIFCIGTASPPNVNGVFGNNATVLVWNANTASNPGLSFALNQNSDLFGAGSIGVKHRTEFFREMVILLNYDGTNVTTWIDGICVDSEAHAAMTINGGVAVGSLYTNETANMSIGVSAIAGGRRSLSLSEIRTVNAYFGQRFLQTTNQRVVVMGDSIYEGTSGPANGTFVDVLTPSILAGYLENSARGGRTMAEQASLTVGPYAQMYGSVRRGQVVILGPGSIDIANEVNPATVLANTATVVSYLHAQGAIVIVPPMIDKVATNPANQATVDTNRATYNAAILGGSTGSDYTVPALASVAELYANGAHSNTDYFIDGSHLTALGTSLLVPPFVPVIQTSMGNNQQAQTVVNITTGTTGAQTINSLDGSVNFAAAAASLVVTNSLVTSTSLVEVFVMTNDATAVLDCAVSSTGSFTIFMSVNPTAETRVGFRVR